MAYLFLAIAFVLNASANMLLKVAASNGFSFGHVLRLNFGAGEWYAVVAAVLFAGNLAAYLVALARIPLSVGYPIMIGMTFLITTSFAVFLGERITALELVGMAAILLGIFVVIYATA